MGQDPSCEANRSSSNQEIPCILWIPDVHYCIYVSLPPIPILSHTQSNFLKSHFNTIFPFMPWSSKHSLSLRFTHQNLLYASPYSHTCHMSQPSGCLFAHPNNIWWAVRIINLLIMQSTSLSYYKSIQSINQDQLYIWIICAFLRWA